MRSKVQNKRLAGSPQMSSIEVSAIKRDIGRHEFFSTFVSVRSREPKWQKFPPCVMVKEIVPNLGTIRNFKVHEDDVFLCGFPRSGATIMQEIIWLTLNEFDFDTAQRIAVEERFPTLEKGGKVIIHANELRRPRTIKTYLPAQFLPDDLFTVRPKIVYLNRDVKDVAISAYHYIVDDLHSYATLDEFLQEFLDDKIIFTPYWEHLVNFASMPGYQNRLLEIEYDWMVENVEETISRVAKFLGREVSSENFERLKAFIEGINKLKRPQIASRCVMPAEFVTKFEEFTQKARHVKSDFDSSE